MLKVIFSSIILIFMLASCQPTQSTKETVILEPNVTDTIGSETIEAQSLTSNLPQVNYRIFFRTSNSIDNALIQSEIRTHIIFNQAKIKEQKFTPTGRPAISYNRVFHWPYYMEIKFNNDSIAVWGVYVGGVNGKAFTHYPNVVNNLLKDDHPARMVTFKGSSKQIATKNAWRNQDISLRVSDVYYDNKLVLTDYYHPMNKLSNTADFGHKY
jgi:hypothetical protein